MCVCVCVGGRESFLGFFWSIFFFLGFFVWRGNNNKMEDPNKDKMKDPTNKRRSNPMRVRAVDLVPFRFLISQRSCKIHDQILLDFEKKSCSFLTFWVSLESPHQGDSNEPIFTPLASWSSMILGPQSHPHSYTTRNARPSPRSHSSNSPVMMRRRRTQRKKRRSFMRRTQRTQRTTTKTKMRYCSPNNPFLIHF